MVKKGYNKPPKTTIHITHDILGNKKYVKIAYTATFFNSLARFL